MCAADMCHPIPYSSVPYRTILISTEPYGFQIYRVPHRTCLWIGGLWLYNARQGISRSDRTRSHSQEGRVPAPRSKPSQANSYYQINWFKNEVFDRYCGRFMMVSAIFIKFPNGDPLCTQWASLFSMD
jgi:hypothetical protein